MRFLLDTNIISNVTKPKPSEALIGWILYISSLTVAEICRGVLEKPAGSRRSQLKVWLFGPRGPPSSLCRSCSALR